MKHPPIIGISGPARSGKDTVASFILAMTGGYRYGFADPIKAMLVPLGIDMTDPYWQERKDSVIPALGVSPRRLMQTLGTEWGRNIIHSRLWVILANARFLNTGHGMVIPDVRFNDEADWVRGQGGLIIHIRRKDAWIPESEHESEAGILQEPDDAYIENNGTLEDLQEKVREVLG